MASESVAPTPIVLIASGLDPSGGAGFILDSRVVRDHGVEPVGVVTALTVQDSRAARRCEPVSAEVIGEQLGAVLSDIEVAAVKIGLVPSADIAKAIADALAQTAAPVVWDPVFAASAGATLLYDDPRAIAQALAPECALITPNLGEAAVLGESGKAIRAAFGCDVLITGGHGDATESIDVLFTTEPPREFKSSRSAGPAPRGTGCFLSAAIAAELALGATLFEAIASAKSLISKRIAAAILRGRGAPVLW